MLRSHRKSAKTKISLNRLIRYRFENTLSKGTPAIILWLSILTVLSSLIFGCLIVAFQVKPSANSENFDFPEAFWQSFLHTIDTGAIQGDSSWSYRAIAILATIMGVFIFSSLIGVLTNGLDKAFTNLRKGKSEVLEHDYTLILGWSPSIYKIINELIVGHCDLDKRSIVILADMDKITMEDELKTKIHQKSLLKSKFPNNPGYRQPSRIICRTGDPLDLDDLKIVKPQNAKAIIILPREEKNPDAFTIKCILALYSLGVKQPIITEIKQKSNRDVIEHDFKDEQNLILLPAFDWLSKITAQTSHQSGYSAILAEIINYQKSEIYIVDAPDILLDHSFESSLLAINNCILLGIEKNRNNRPSEFVLNPMVKAGSEEEERFIRKGDRLIVLMDDEAKVEVDGLQLKQKRVSFSRPPSTPHLKPEIKLLILGWNNKISTILNEICNYISEASFIKIVTDDPNQAALFSNLKASSRYEDLNLTLINGSPSEYEILENQNIKEYDSVLVLGKDEAEVQEKDANTILTLLHLNKLSKASEINIVAEIYDDKNRIIAQSLKACDFIISENIISSLMAQLSQQKELFEIFNELFDSSGCEIYLKPISAYTELDKKVSFFSLLQCAALEHGEIALGYRLYKDFNNPETNYGVCLKPKITTQLTFCEKDMIIVLGLTNF